MVYILSAISSNHVPQPDGTLKNVVRKKILHYHQFYTDLFDPIVLMPVPVNASGRLYDDFLRLFFLNGTRGTSDLSGELRNLISSALFALSA